MEPFASPSFIPKKSLITAPSRKAHSSVGLFSLIGILTFVVSIIFYAGTFAYGKVLKQRIVSLTESLKRQEQAFDSDTLFLLTQTDGKLLATRDILRNHTTLIPLFDLLSEATLQTVRFKSFQFASNPELRRFELKMTGEARNYSAIALQSDAFVEKRKLKDIVFSDLNLDQNGRVVFNFSATVDPTLLSYEQSLAGEEAGPVTPESETQNQAPQQ